MIKTFINGEKVKLSKHLNSYDFRCKCGELHKIKIDTKLVDILEGLFNELNADSIQVISGFRCKKQDIKVGGSGKGYHTKGKAVDVYYIKDNKRIYSSTLCITLENMNFYQGIGYRSGGSLDSKGNTHIATRLTQSFINEASKTPTKPCCKSWYKYFKVEYKTLTTMNIRKNPGTKYEIVKRYKPGTYFRAYEIKHKNNEIWLRCNDGWICLSQKDKKYCKLEGIL